MQHEVVPIALKAVVPALQGVHDFYYDGDDGDDGDELARPEDIIPRKHAPERNVDGEAFATALAALSGWGSLLYNAVAARRTDGTDGVGAGEGDIDKLLDGDEGPLSSPNARLRAATTALVAAAMTASVSSAVAGDTDNIEAALQRKYGYIAPVSTSAMVAGIRSGVGFYGCTAAGVALAISQVFKTGVPDPLAMYALTAPLDVQWCYAALLSASAAAALSFLKVCHAKQSRGITYARALQLVMKARAPARNSVDVMAWFMARHVRQP